jgi:hypothetical protein
VGVALSPVWSALTRHRGAPAAVAVGGEPSFTAEEVRAVARAVAREAVPLWSAEAGDCGSGPPGGGCWAEPINLACPAVPACPNLTAEACPACPAWPEERGAGEGFLALVPHLVALVVPFLWRRRDGAGARGLEEQAVDRATRRRTLARGVVE